MTNTPEQPEDIPKQEQELSKRAEEVLKRAEATNPELRKLVDEQAAMMRMMERRQRWDWMREVSEMARMLTYFLDSDYIPEESKQKARETFNRLADLVISKNEALLAEIERSEDDTRSKD